MKTRNYSSENILSTGFYTRIFLLLGLMSTLNCSIYAQGAYFSVDTLSSSDVKLLHINLREGNTYFFDLNLKEDSVYLLMPAQLPRGYYEAYYEGDTNQLALTYYRFGKRSYAQQYYKDGTMKSDTEYDRYGLMHGMHVLYNRLGEEIWHVDYYHGTVERRYSLEYVDTYNYTKELIEKDKAWGCYEFSPTPMRDRHDQILLNKDGTFHYHNFKVNCDCRRHSKGNWKQINNQLELTIDDSEVWGQPTRNYVIVASPWLRRKRLIQLLPWGVDWYNSEFWFCKKCDCIKK